MKLRHLILYFVSCVLLILADLPGGSLIAIFAWLQIYTLWTQPMFTRTTQIWATKLFFLSIPFIFFWGSIHSFLFIYQKENLWSMTLGAGLLSLVLCLIGSIYFVFVFKVGESAEYQAIRTLRMSYKAIQTSRFDFFKISSILFVFSLIPALAAEWKIVFAITATHLYISRRQLPQVFAADR